MKQPKESYPHAFVPEHLTKLTVEKLPLDEPHYIVPGERDDSEPLAIFVDPDRKLKMSKSHAIDIYDTLPASPLGLVGIMKTFVADPSTNTTRDAYVADLRFIDDHQLVDSEEAQRDITDQEEYMHWVAEMNNTIEFEAFIASEIEIDQDSDIPEGVFYGNPSLYDVTLKLYKRSNELMKAHLKEERARRKKEKNAKADKQPKDTSVNSKQA